MLRKIDAMHSIFGIDPQHKCKDCEHLCSYTASRKWYKCEVYGTTRSDATDWRLSNTACGLYPNKEYKGRPVIETLKGNHAHKEEGHIEGQMTLWIGGCDDGKD